MDLGLKGAAAAITGGTKGMGRATAECFAAEGARVAILARGQDALDETVLALEKAGSPDVIGLSTDVTNRGEVERSFATIGERWGSLNALINTIGPSAGRFEELTDEGWTTAFSLGTMSAVHCVRAALPLLRAAEWARIV